MSLYLRQICLVAAELNPSIEALTETLSLSPCFIDPGVKVFGLENKLLRVGSQFIEVVAPIEDNTAAGRFLDRRQGDGGYMVITQALSCEKQQACRENAENLGVRVAWERQHDTAHYMQLHPRDTGGAFFEIDWDSEEEPEGNWVPAGGKLWQDTPMTGPVQAIIGAELQSSDPEALAKRWSAIAGTSPEKTSTNGWELPLFNATIRFVPLSDDRGEGLSALDLSVNNKDEILACAKKHGHLHDQTSVHLCGTRINLM